MPNLLPPPRLTAPVVLTPIGRLSTPYARLEDCPRGPAGPAAGWIELFPAWREGLLALEPGQDLRVLAWFDQADRATLTQVVPHDGVRRGVFACRSPARPNPIALTRVRLVAIEGERLKVVGLDSLDGTLVLDLKPAEVRFAPSETAERLA